MIVRTRILPTFPIRLKFKGIIAHFFREIQQAPVLPECLPVLSKIGCALLYGTLSVNFRNNIRQELLAVDNITNLLVAVNLTLDGDGAVISVLLELLYKNGEIPAYMFRNILNEYADVADPAQFTVMEEREEEAA